jgi:hypothetical protein
MDNPNTQQGKSRPKVDPAAEILEKKKQATIKMLEQL